MSNKLHFYTKYSKEKIKISDKPFASGGEGAIYAIASPRSYNHLVAKIYYPEKRTPEREAKMRYLMQHPPITFQEGQAPSIGWVQDLVYKDKRFIGILLIKIEGKKLTKLTLFKLPRRADKAWQRFSLTQPNALKLRLRTCFNLAVVIHQIHESGQYVLVDLKPDNVLMQPNGLLAVVDMDSVEVIENGKAIFAAPVATPEYTPPEHYIGPRTVIEETWDHFSLGVIFYQLLLGLHPFAASCNPPYDNLVSIHDKIEKDLYVHHSKKKAFFKVIPPPHQQFYKMPVEIQELFQNCFEYGAKEPYLRPSPADWCNTLADLLKLPFKKIPKTNIPPSNLYFSPTVLIEALPLAVPILPDNHPIPHLDSKDLVPTNFQKETLVAELKVAYKKHLHQHRERILQSVLIVIIITFILAIQFFNFPLFFGVGLLLVLIFIAAPQLFLTKFQDSIDNIGKTILSKSAYQLLQLDEKSVLKKEKVQSSNQYIDALLSKKEKALEDEKEELSRNKNNNQEELDFIQQHLQKRANLEQRTILLKDWVEVAESEILAAREQELEQYKMTNEGFLTQLKEDATYKAYNFRSFRNLRMKIQQEINILKGSLALLEKPLKQLHLNQQKKFEKLTNINHAPTVQSYRKGLEAASRKELAAFKKENTFVNEHEKTYANFEKKSKILSYNNHQKQQKVKHQLNKSFDTIRKDLGLNSKFELDSYIDLLENSQEELQVNFASNQVQKQFEVFLQKINALNIDSIFSANTINILTKRTLPKINFDTPQKVKNIKTLSDLQQNMVNIWGVNKSKLKEFDALIEQLAESPDMLQDQIEMSYWAKTAREQLINIILNLKQYAEIQSVFYGDPIIFRLKNKLKTYQEETQNAAKKVQDLEAEYLNKLNQLEAENSTLVEKQKQLETLKEEQERLILEKEETLKASVEKETAIYLASLKRQQAELIEEKTKEHQEELKSLERQIKHKQAGSALKLKQVEQVLNKLNLDHANFEAAIDRIRDQAELVYTSKRLSLDQKCQELTNLVHEIQTEHPKALQLTKKNVIYYQELKVRLLEYKDKLNELNQLQEDKIRLDTLSEWQKSYDSRIYIKDLLLNKVEQFEQYEQKKK